MDISSIRDTKEKVINNEKNRFNDMSKVEVLFKVDEFWKELRNELDMYNRAKSDISKSVKNSSNEIKLDIEGHEDDIILKIKERKYELCNLTKGQLVRLSKILGAEINIKKNNLDKLENERKSLLSNISNFLDPRVVISNNENENLVLVDKVNIHNDERIINELNHVNLCERLNLINTERGSAIAGNRGYFLNHYGVLLNNAVIRYAIDFLVERNFNLLYTPFFMKKDKMSKVAQLSEFDESLYRIDTGDDTNPTYLIATSEQPLTALHENTYLNDSELPIKYAGQSTCFRKETGAHGKDTLGIFRVHQFEKIEQFCITAPDKSNEMMDEMMKNCKDFYDSLGISYRIVSIVSGALNNAAAIKYDLEAYFPGSKSYRELVSCSNCTDYQSRKADIKYKDNDSGHVHMLNSTLCANTRTMCCILETYQTNEGVIIPEVLRKYMNGKDFLEFEINI